MHEIVGKAGRYRHQCVDSSKTEVICSTRKSRHVGSGMCVLNTDDNPFHYCHVQLKVVVRCRFIGAAKYKPSESLKKKRAMEMTRFLYLHRPQPAELYHV